MKEILKTEWSEEFDELAKNRSVTSYFKYGPIAVNFGQKLASATKSVALCLTKYEETGNTEYLVDARNYLMFEFIYPQHKNAHFRATESSESAGRSGTSINELKNIREVLK